MTDESGTTALSLIRMHPGVDPARFAHFSQTVDQPACLAHDVVRGIELFAVERAGGDAPPIDFVELMDLRSWDEWVAVRDGDAELRIVGAQFGALADPDTVVTYLCRRVPSEKEHR